MKPVGEGLVQFGIKLFSLPCNLTLRMLQRGLQDPTLVSSVATEMANVCNTSKAKGKCAFCSG